MKSKLNYYTIQREEGKIKWKMIRSMNIEKEKRRREVSERERKKGVKRVFIKNRIRRARIVIVIEYRNVFQFKNSKQLLSNF